MSPTPEQTLSGLWERIKEDWESHGRDPWSPGFRAMVVYRFGVWRMGVGSLAARAPLSVLYRMLYRKVRDRYGIEIPFTARIGRRVVFEHQHGIVVHGLAEIGDDCVIRQGVTLGNRQIGRPYDAPRLGRRVNVGAGAMLLGAIQIGDDAQIGANAVVCDDLPAGAVAIGVPARVVRINDTQVTPNGGATSDHGTPGATNGGAARNGGGRPELTAEAPEQPASGRARAIPDA